MLTLDLHEVMMVTLKRHQWCSESASRLSVACIAFDGAVGACMHAGSWHRANDRQCMSYLMEIPTTAKKRGNCWQAVASGSSTCQRVLGSWEIELCLMSFGREIMSALIHAYRTADFSCTTIEQVAEPAG